MEMPNKHRIVELLHIASTILSIIKAARQNLITLKRSRAVATSICIARYKDVERGGGPRYRLHSSKCLGPVVPKRMTTVEGSLGGIGESSGNEMWIITGVSETVRKQHAPGNSNSQPLSSAAGCCVSCLR